MPTNMIEIIDNVNILSQAHHQLIEEIILLAAKHIGLHQEFQVDISIVDTATIHELNKVYRGMDKPTDVLSFALEEHAQDDDFPEIIFDEEDDVVKVLGDIVICDQKISDQAQEYGHSFERELAFLVVHGFLHVNGYDHQTPEEEAEMFGIQEEVLADYGLSR